jgi:hypothetical protein
MLQAYMVLAYVIMTLISVLAYNIEPKKITYKDWLIWLSAPVTVPLFLIFYLNNKPKN